MVKELSEKQQDRDAERPFGVEKVCHLTNPNQNLTLIYYVYVYVNVLR